jgi:hypothetical protein
MKKQNKELIKDIKIFIEYSVERTERLTALNVLKEYENNTIALSAIRDFYARLPEFREEAVVKVSRIVSRHGAYLLGISTKNFQYLYFFNDNTPLYLGEKKDGIGDNEVLNFFGFSTNDEFLKTVDTRSHQYADFKGKVNTFCPACAVATGECHQLGCPVEICPWCDGQLNICNCRFEQLGVDEITDESEIDRLETLLNDKGRIPFSADHAPAYPTAGEEDTESC